jgi:hypothetical protein
MQRKFSGIRDVFLINYIYIYADSPLSSQHHTFLEIVSRETIYKRGSLSQNRIGLDTIYNASVEKLSCLQIKN